MKNQPPSLIAPFWLLLAAVGVMALPADVQSRIRLTAGDVLKPGSLAAGWLDQYLSKAVSTCCNTRSESDAERNRLRQELAESNRKLHQLEIQLARAQESAAAQEPPLFSTTSATQTDRLTHIRLIEAAVLGDANADAWRTGRWLDQGKSAGLWEEGPILSAASPLIDIGRDARVSPEDALVWGRTVIGKVHHVGRWTSTFRLVTDAEFVDRVQLIHPTPDGYVFGSKGILRGQGEPLCRLDGIPASETVNIGDLVYTAGRDGLLPTPLYYGCIATASLDDAALEWRIEVEPARRPDDLTMVHVLKTTLNPRRMAN